MGEEHATFASVGFTAAGLSFTAVRSVGNSPAFATQAVLASNASNAARKHSATPQIIRRADFNTNDLAFWKSIICDKMRSAHGGRDKRTLVRRTKRLRGYIEQEVRSRSTWHGLAESNAGWPVRYTPCFRRIVDLSQRRTASAAPETRLKAPCTRSRDGRHRGCEFTKAIVCEKARLPEKIALGFRGLAQIDDKAALKVLPMLDLPAVHQRPCTCGPTRFAHCFENPPASTWALSKTRRGVDILVALAALLLLSFPLAAIALFVRLTSKGPALYFQQRVGRYGRLFRIYKFRSMHDTWTAASGPWLTRSEDKRVTPLGRWLRRLKLDELPQFLNVLRGDMTLVGPRPTLPRYVVIPRMPYRPGITSPATIAFCREEELLNTIDPRTLNCFYAECIRPQKARLDLCYQCRATPLSDLRILLATLIACLVQTNRCSVSEPETASTWRSTPEQDCLR